VEDYREKRKKGWILKLDLEKIFDRVDWNSAVNPSEPGALLLPSAFKALNFLH